MNVDGAEGESVSGVYSTGGSPAMAVGVDAGGSSVSLQFSDLRQFMWVSGTCKLPCLSKVLCRVIMPGNMSRSTQA